MSILIPRRVKSAHEYCAAHFAARVKRVGSAIATDAFLRHAKKAAKELSDTERANVRRDVEALQKWSTEMLRVLRRA